MKVLPELLEVPKTASYLTGSWLLADVMASLAEHEAAHPAADEQGEPQ